MNIMTMKIESLISNKKWRGIYYKLCCFGEYYRSLGYTEYIGISYTFNPVTDHIMTNTSTLFDIKKAAAMYFWYKNGDRFDHSIIEYFDEYKKCIDELHQGFNSNYGYYAYTKKGLEKCVIELANNSFSRQACFCINNDAAMSKSSIDKLCTNVIQFFIRNNMLTMVVQMRSSNFITLLPYDAFMFSVFYMQVYKKLKCVYPQLQTGLVNMQVASLHVYDKDLQKAFEKSQIPECIIDFDSDFCEKKLENYLLHKLEQM